MFDLIYRFDPANAGIQRAPQSWEEACKILVQGSRDFAGMTDARNPEQKTWVIPFDPRALGWGIATEGVPAQVQFAAVLGCADARVPTEMIFSKGCNELFVVRVAGNVATPDNERRVSLTRLGISPVAGTGRAAYDLASDGNPRGERSIDQTNCDRKVLVAEFFSAFAPLTMKSGCEHTIDHQPGSLKMCQWDIAANWPTYDR